MNWKNIVNRAVWTFVQGALGALVLVQTAPVDVAGWKAIGLAAGAAGIAALASFVKTVITEYLNPTVTLPIVRLSE